MTSSNALLQEPARAARQWLFEEAAPLWSTAGRTGSGLFAEQLMLAPGQQVSAWRTFVQARHIFSFVTIGELGWDGPWRRLAREGIATLLASAKRSDGFFVHSLNADASVFDGRADLYDQAFILLALGITGSLESQLFDEAEWLLDRLDRDWGDPQGGYFEGEIADQRIRRQNPHMHLLEALIELSARSGRPRFRDAAFQLAELAASKFMDPVTGALLEYFDDRLSPATGKEGRLTEPGHCFEWAWLFERLSQMGWVKGASLSEALTKFARFNGVDPARGVVVNELTLDGEVTNDWARLWPQTERLKVAVARFCRLGTLDEDLDAAAAARSLRMYLDVRTPGAWRDKLRSDGTWVDEPAPGSSFYHLTCAYSELIRASDPQPGERRDAVAQALNDAPAKRGDRAQRGR